MAPTKTTRAASKQATTATSKGPTALLPLARKGLTRRTTHNILDQNAEIMHTRAKRKADNSPVKNDKVKRSALGNLTNNAKMTSTLHPDEDTNQQHEKKKDNINWSTQALHIKETQNTLGEGGPVATVAYTRQTQHKVMTRATSRNAMTTKDVCDHNKTKVAAVVATDLSVKVKNVLPAAPPPAPHAVAAPMAIKSQLKPVRRISNEFNKTEESLYMSALEDISSCESIRLSGNFEAAKRRSALLQQEKLKTKKSSDENAGAQTLPAIEQIPEGVEDFDKVNWNDPFQVSHYAMDIFNYLKSREAQFKVDDYMERQVNLSVWMRTLLVDWMVEVQETFELNHETLYLGVKIVDLFLTRLVIKKEKLQLLGAAALYIACKFDERTPPLVEDFLYICDGAYKHDELVKMEMTALKTIQFDLGVPLSYRFLRRYARCAKVSMPSLTLARFILEYSLMNYDIITLSDSKLAAAALFMALRMHGHAKPWTATFEYYSGYKIVDFAEEVRVLNVGMHRKRKEAIKTIRSKYSHKIFHEVAKVPLMTTDKLFENNLDLNTSGLIDHIDTS